jgi:dynein heavy chain
MKTIFVAITKGFLGNFTSQQKALAEPVVDSSIFLYQKIVKELLPTPAKSHYTFNLRDLAKVIQGMLMTEASKIKETDALIRLWTVIVSLMTKTRHGLMMSLKIAFNSTSMWTWL